MHMSVVCILAISALISCIVSMMGKCPLYIPVLLLAIVAVLSCLSLR